MESQEERIMKPRRGVVEEWREMERLARYLEDMKIHSTFQCLV